MKLSHWFWRRRFLNVVNVFSLFRNYLPLEKGMALHLDTLESPSIKDALCQVWMKLAQWFWRKRFLYFVNLYLLLIISSWKRTWFFSWTNLDSSHQRVLSFDKKGPLSLEKTIFLISSMYFRYFVIISPWKRAGPFIWTNLNPL